MNDSRGIITLGKNLEILSGSPLPEYNAPGGPAFAAKSRNEANPSMVAIICNSTLPTRVNFVNVARTIDSSCIPRLRESEIVHWPAADASYMALVYDPPTSPRYWHSLDEAHAPMNEDVLNRNFIQPMLTAFSELQRTGIVHGAIRINNIFWSDGSTSSPQLGECLSAPPGVNQPVLFEPIERALCNQLGKGQGTHVDDVYALGVTLAFMILGRNPLKGMDDRAIIQAKLDKGTFGALIGNHRLPGSQIELLRGLLSDDARLRWTAKDMQEWFSGRRITPKSSSNIRRANRSIEFTGNEYWHVRQLTAAMAENVHEAVRIIENKDIERWLQRSLNDQQRFESFMETLEEFKSVGKTSNYEDQLVTRACIALDPTAPIRYRGISVMPDGIGIMLAEAMMSEKNLQVLSEIISSQFATLWVNSQSEMKSDFVPLAQQLERMRTIMEKRNYGNGIERVVYELNPTLPCASPILKNQYVSSLKRLLPALERIAKISGHPSEPVDRHIAAFLSFHDKKGEMLFEQIGKADTAHKRGLALLTMFADLQYRYGPDALPGMAGWLTPLLEPSIKRLFNRLLQEKARKQLKDTATRGNLGSILGIVDDSKLLHKDEADFLNARLFYRSLTREALEIGSKLENREGLMASVGRPMAAAISSFLAIILITIAVGRVFLQILL